MDNMMNNQSRSTGTTPLFRGVPPTLAVLAGVSGFLIPRNDDLYLIGHSAALVLALAVPLSYGWLNRGTRIEEKGLHRFLLAGLGVFGAASAVASGIFLTYGSSPGAAGDIGGMLLWVVSSGGLIVLSIGAAISWPKVNPSRLPMGN